MPATALAQLGQLGKESGGKKCSTPESETSDLAHRNAVGRTTYSMEECKGVCSIGNKERQYVNANDGQTRRAA
jgi:hypothetical protein